MKSFRIYKLLHCYVLTCSQVDDGKALYYMIVTCKGNSMGSSAI